MYFRPDLSDSVAGGQVFEPGEIVRLRDRVTTGTPLAEYGRGPFTVISADEGGVELKTADERPCKLDGFRSNYWNPRNLELVSE